MQNRHISTLILSLVLLAFLRGSAPASRALAQPSDVGLRFFDPVSVAVDRAGDVDVFQRGVSRISRLSPGGRLLAAWSVKTARTFPGPGRLTSDEAGTIAVLLGNSRQRNMYLGGVETLSPTGHVLARWYRSSLRDAELLAAGRNGYLFAVVPVIMQGGDRQTGRVVQLSPLGQVARSWLLSTDGHDFMAPAGIATDARGNVYVSGSVGSCRRGCQGREGKFCQNPCGSLNSYAIDLHTGRVRWVHAGNGGGQPILAGGRLFQNWDVPNSTRIYDPISGRLLAALPAHVLLADAGGVYGAHSTVPGLGCHTWLGRYSLRGQPVWTEKLGLCNAVSASLGYGALYVTAARDSLGDRPAGGWVLALNPANGHVRWARNIGSIEGISLADHMVFVLRTSIGGQVLTYDAATGRPMGALAMPRYTPGMGQPFVITGGTVYLANGVRLVALRSVPLPPLVGH